jgi:glycosyltransferase involved in cell wall biosynthesis
MRARLSDAIVVISDLVEASSLYCGKTWPQAQTAGPVVGGYLERLPLAAVAAGLADFAEIWHHHRGSDIASNFDTGAGLMRRTFPLQDEDAPYNASSMLDFVHKHGAPRILCVWGLGVSEALLEACADSIIIYNSIDVPALRVPPEVSRHFDLVLTGERWQSDEVEARHPGMATAVLPIGPEFASPETFVPIAGPKPYDVIYVAAAQAYKRHDVLFDALARAERPLKALCVMGYGEDGQILRDDAAARGLDVDFVGPPGVSHAEVNRLMNLAKVGVVCGENDGAPAILTEYMLAGLPVVANAALRCGLQYILPETGLAASADSFDKAILQALDGTHFAPRQTVLDRWSYPHSIAKLAALIGDIAPIVTNRTHPNSIGGQIERANLV